MVFANLSRKIRPPDVSSRGVMHASLLRYSITSQPGSFEWDPRNLLLFGSDCFMSRKEGNLVVSYELFLYIFYACIDKETN